MRGIEDVIRAIADIKFLGTASCNIYLMTDVELPTTMTDEGRKLRALTISHPDLVQDKYLRIYGRMTTGTADKVSSVGSAFVRCISPFGNMQDTAPNTNTFRAIIVQCNTAFNCIKFDGKIETTMSGGKLTTP